MTSPLSSSESTMAHSLAPKPDLIHRSNSSRSRSKNGKTYRSEQMMFYEDIFGSIPKYTPPSYTSVFADTLQQQITSSSFGDEYIVKQKASVGMHEVFSSPPHALESHTGHDNGNRNGHERGRAGSLEGRGGINTISYDHVFGGISSISVSSSGPEILSDLLGNEGNHLKSSKLDMEKDSYLFGEEPMNETKSVHHTLTSFFIDSAPVAKDNEMLKDNDGNITMARYGIKKPSSSRREEAQGGSIDPSSFDEKWNCQDSKPKEYTHSTHIEKNHMAKDRLSGLEAEHGRIISSSSPHLKSSSSIDNTIPPVEASQPQGDDRFWISIGDVKLITEPTASPAPARQPPLPGSRIKISPPELPEIKIRFLSVDEARDTTNVTTVSKELVIDVSASQEERTKDVLASMPVETVNGSTDMLVSFLDVTKKSVDVSKEGMSDDLPMTAKECVNVMKESVNDGSSMDVTKGSMEVTIEGVDGLKTEIEKPKDCSQEKVEENIEGTTHIPALTMDVKKEVMDVTNVCIINSSRDISGSVAEKKMEGSMSMMESAMDMTKERMDVTKGDEKAAPKAEIDKFNDISTSIAHRNMDEESTSMPTSSMDIEQESVHIPKEVIMSSQINESQDISVSMAVEKIKASTNILTSDIDVIKEMIDVQEASNNINEAEEKNFSEGKEMQKDSLKPNDRKTEEEKIEAIVVPQSEHIVKGGISSALEDSQLLEECPSEKTSDEMKNETEEIEMVPSENEAVARYQKQTEESECQRFDAKEVISKSKDTQGTKSKTEDRKIEEREMEEVETKEEESAEGYSEEGESEDVFLECEYQGNDDDDARESAVSGECEADQEVRGNEEGEKQRNEKQEVVMVQRDKEPEERHEKENETQKYAAMENNDKIKLEDEKAEDSISHGNHLEKNDKARESVIVENFEAVEEGKGNGRDEITRNETVKAQEKYQVRESQRHHAKESIQKDPSGFKDMQDDRLHPKRRGNEEKATRDGVTQGEYLGKKDKVKDDGPTGSFRPQQAGRDQERGEKQGKGREERLKIEKDKETRERHQKEKEERERQREREKDRITIEMFTREAHERARERERVNAETWERAAAEAREMKMRETKFAERVKSFSKEREKASPKERTNTNSLSQERLNVADPREKARAALNRANSEMLERSVVERAASEARARALRAAMERAKSDIRDRASSPVSMQSNRSSPSGSFRNVASMSTKTRSGPLFMDTFIGSSASVEFQETEGEPVERRKARMERHQRTVERQAKALEEKNERDRQMQREQAERHRIAQIVDMDIKRWVAGKEGNLRALLSTLQYILWRESGWQPIPLTDLLLAASVKKAYRKATLCVHPDKVQQKGATIQQKYVAEKVFDLLKEAWTKFSSDEML